MLDIKNEGILETVKTMMGGAVEYSEGEFDTELVVDINTVLSILNQMGIGKQNFVLIGDEVWADFLGQEDESKYQQVKTYVYLKVKQMFDPPSNSSVLNALQERINELEWRIHNLANY